MKTSLLSLTAWNPLLVCRGDEERVNNESLTVCLILLNRSLESRKQPEDVFAHTGSPGFPGQGPKQGGDPRLLPRGREGAAAAVEAGAAGAAEGMGMVAGAQREPPGAVLREEVFGEEAAVVRGAGCTAGAGGAHVPKNTVISRSTPVATVTGQPPAMWAACGGALGGVRGEVEAAVVQVTWKHNQVPVSENSSCREVWQSKFVTGFWSSYLWGTPSSSLARAHTSIRRSISVASERRHRSWERKCLWFDSWGEGSPRIRRFSCNVSACSSTRFSCSDCCMGKKKIKTQWLSFKSFFNWCNLSVWHVKLYSCGRSAAI